MSDDVPPEPPKAPAPPQDGDVPAERMDLPKWNRARVKRAQPAADDAPDGFQQGVRAAGRTAVRRGPLVFAGVAAIAGIIGGTIWWTRHKAETTAASTRLLAQSAAWRARGIVEDVDAIMKERKRPPPLPIARDEAELDANVDAAIAALMAGDDSSAQHLGLLVRAAESFERSDFAAAQASYDEFLTKVGDGHLLAFVAREGIALAREGQGDLEGALAELDKLMGAEGDFYRDQALWQRARLLEQLGRNDEALALYHQYATEYPLDKASMAKAAVRERLGELDPQAVPPEPGLGGPGGLGGLGGLGGR